MTIVKEEASNAKKQSELHKYQQAMMRRADTRAGAETRTYNEGAHADMHEKIRLSRRIFETTMDRAAKAEQHETFVQQVQAMEDKTRYAHCLNTWLGCKLHCIHISCIVQQSVGAASPFDLLLQP